jgi:hypothetical protein
MLCGKSETSKKYKEAEPLNFVTSFAVIMRLQDLALVESKKD